MTTKRPKIHHPAFVQLSPVVSSLFPAERIDKKIQLKYTNPLLESSLIWKLRLLKLFVLYRVTVFANTQSK